MRVDRLQLDNVRQLISQLADHGDDNDVTSLYAKIRAQLDELRSVLARHDVSVCRVRFRSSVSAAAAERGNLIGKLAILDVGQCHHGV